MSLSKQKQPRLSEQMADKIEIFKDLTGASSGCTSPLTVDVKNDCWLRQLVLIESLVREVPEYIACMVDSLKSSVRDRKCLKSWRKKFLNNFKAKVCELKDKIDQTLIQFDILSDGVNEEEQNIDSEVKHDAYAICDTTENVDKNTIQTQVKDEYKDQISSYCQVKLEENIVVAHNLSPNYDSSSDDDRPLGTSTAPQFACPDCSDVLTSLRALHIHRRQVHCELKPHKCDRCPLAFKHNSTLRRHQRTPHNREKQQPYLCDLCPQVCANKNKFKAHRRTHTGENRFVCDICSRTLGTKNCLVTHMRTHTNERPFECSECFKTFRQKSGFRIHRLTHTDHRPHKCIWCVKSFLTKTQLSRHVLSHTGERPHSCPICKRGYKKRYVCKKHIQRAHRDVDVDVVFPNLPKRSNKITVD